MKPLRAMLHRLQVNERRRVAREGRIGYLILCHNDPEHVERLCAALEHPSDRFVIHLDARCDAALWHPRFQPNEAVSWVADRVAINWGGFSMVQATLNALRHALVLEPKLDRFCLLSGSSYPVAPTADIRAGLLKPVNYLSAMPIGSEHKNFQRIARYHLIDFPNLVGRKGAGTRQDPELRQYLGEFLDSLPALPPLPIKYYRGSQWWALTRPCVERLMARIADPDFAPVLHRFRYSEIPDESFFQSVVCNHERGRLNQATHYVDWRPVEGQLPPRVLALADYERIVASRLWFARKMNSKISADLLDALDARRRTPEAVAQAEAVSESST